MVADRHVAGPLLASLPSQTELAGVDDNRQQIEDRIDRLERGEPRWVTAPTLAVVN
jgi:hypothetical protein